MVVIRPRAIGGATTPGRQLATRQCTAIQSALGRQLIKRIGMLRCVDRLAFDHVPIQTQPGEILLQAGGEFGATALAIEVLKPQHQSSRTRPGIQPTKQCCQQGSWMGTP